MPNSDVESERPRSRLRRFASGVLIVLLLLAAAGFLYENISEARDRRFNPMPGTLVDVGGRKMHIDCSGAGTPTVVLDSGLGVSYDSWHKVQPEIAKFSRVCSYDRAGLGYSEAISGPRTSRHFAEELHALLGAAGIAPPYVLVGHSMGGYDVRLFASLYRNEVAGMVLVDSSHPDQENRFPPELKNMEGSWRREAEFEEYTIPFGIPRLLGFCNVEAMQRTAECNWPSAREGTAELENFSISAAETAATGALGDMPLAVLSHDPDRPSNELPPEVAKTTNEAWKKMQSELAQLSSRGTQAVVKNSGHYIQIDQPAAVIGAVRNVVEQARQTPATEVPVKSPASD